MSLGDGFRDSKGRDDGQALDETATLGWDLMAGGAKAAGSTAHGAGKWSVRNGNIQCR
jgi:hypothetical protein